MKSNSLPEKFGFLNEPITVHTSRTLMFRELEELLQNTQRDLTADEYTKLITESNLLAKPTLSSRKKTAKYLTQLYSLNSDITIFRILMLFWPRDSGGCTLLAALCAHARDSLLRAVSDTILLLPLDHEFNLEYLKERLDEKYPGRFSPKTLHSTARNIASSYQQSGHLKGRRNKRRNHPNVTPIATAYALFLGYISGYRGENLLNTIWAKLLDLPMYQILDFANQAHKLGLLIYKNAGSIIEFSFDNLLTNKERKILSEQN